MGETMIGVHVNGDSVWLGLQATLWAGILLVASCIATPTYAMFPKPVQEQLPERHDLQCFLSEEKILTLTELDVMIGQRKGLRYVIILYSLDGGEKTNLSLLYPLINGHIFPFPTIYVFGDIVNSPETSQTYVDQEGNGNCKEIMFEARRDKKVDE